MFRLWDGRLRYYSETASGLSFQTGLLPNVKEFLQENSREFEEQNQFMPLLNLDPGNVELQGISLRKNQKDALFRMIYEGRGILKAPTGSGKTEIMLAFAQLFLRNSPKYTTALFIVHRESVKDLVYADEGERLEQRLGITEKDCFFDIGGIKAYQYEGRILALAMGQTLSSLLYKKDERINWLLHNTRVSFSDESHAMETFKRKATKQDSKGNKTSRDINILHYFPYCYHRFASSATPIKRDKEEIDMVHWFNVVQSFGNFIEIEHEHTVKPFVYLLDIDYPPREDDTFPEAREALKDSAERNDILLDIAERHDKKGMKTIIFVKHIEYGEFLAELLGCTFLHGDSSAEDRTWGVAEFSGELHGHQVTPEKNILVVSSIFYFGVNIPRIECIILAQIELSYVNVIQAIGRGMRDMEGKEELLVIDFFDNDGSYLQEHSKTRIAHYQSEGIPFKILKYEPGFEEK